MPHTAPDQIDIAALAALLDGQHAGVRAEVRAALVEHASLLADAESLSKDDYRDRVRDVVLSVAAAGQAAYGFPKE